MLQGEIKYKQLLLTTFNFFTMKPPVHYANTHHAIEQGLTGSGIELTSIRYIRDIGLIATSLTGVLKIFDAFSFTNEIWKTSNKTRKQGQHTQITCFDVSVKIGIMVTGGTDGKLVVYDPYAFGVIGAVPEAHGTSSQILRVWIYEEQ